tara:strand:- start:544 stop:840 length:297 start_codon:yes stop_codon:yes gene_type:complete
MNFEQALGAVKAGERVCRSGWNGKGMFIFLVPGSEFQVSRPPLDNVFPTGTNIKYQAHIDIFTAQGTISTWQPSNGDMLADDWELFTGAGEGLLQESV